MKSKIAKLENESRKERKLRLQKQKAVYLDTTCIAGNYYKMITNKKYTNLVKFNKESRPLIPSPFADMSNALIARLIKTAVNEG